MKYLNKFDTRSDYQQSASTLEIPNVAYITATTDVIYNATQPKAYVVFTDPIVEQKCIQLYSTDNIGCTEEDLAAVTALNRNDWSGTSITSFDELGYFTGVKSIPIALFSDCTGLTSVTIPSSVTRFWESSFHHCSSLSAITFPASVTRIGENTFSGCSSLSSITFEATTLPATINSGAFDSLPTTGNITVPSGSESNFYSLAKSLGSGWTVNEQTPPALTEVLFESSATTAESGVYEITLDGVTLSGNNLVELNHTDGYKFNKNARVEISTTGGSITKIEFTPALSNFSPLAGTTGTYTVVDGVSTWVASDAVSTVIFSKSGIAGRCTSIKVYLE